MHHCGTGAHCSKNGNAREIFFWGGNGKFKGEIQKCEPGEFNKIRLDMLIRIKRDYKSDILQRVLLLKNYLKRVNTEIPKSRKLAFSLSASPNLTSPNKLIPEKIKVNDEIQQQTLLLLFHFLLLFWWNGQICHRVRKNSRELLFPRG